ncbi:response regulator [Verrucomicrobium sp. BvORR106]|uniref:response regulator n=1 Tax=Verrucomicrobium sp. BvORR106 TaxID=1403819 RepID=UPI0009E0A5E3|nr:response regulator [Verrucomicrobium sp. BvORR106]
MDEHFPSRRLQILVVEDHADIRGVLDRYLNRMGHRVAVACDLQDARTNLEKCRWDVLICDRNLPDGHGWDLLREMAEAQAPVYAVAMSAAATKQDEADASAAGFAQHLRKPFDLRELDKVVREALLRHPEES